MEEYLLSQLDTPVVLKDGTMMTKPDGTDGTRYMADLPQAIPVPIPSGVRSSDMG